MVGFERKRKGHQPIFGGSLIVGDKSHRSGWFAASPCGSCRYRRQGRAAGGGPGHPPGGRDHVDALHTSCPHGEQEDRAVDEEAWAGWVQLSVVASPNRGVDVTSSCSSLVASSDVNHRKSRCQSAFPRAESKCLPNNGLARSDGPRTSSSILPCRQMERKPLLTTSQREAETWSLGALPPKVGASGGRATKDLGGAATGPQEGQRGSAASRQPLGPLGGGFVLRGRYSLRREGRPGGEAVPKGWYPLRV